jgi:hypothetical protein
MRRLTVFAKGNVDVHDSLVYSRVNDKVEWNGLNVPMAERHADWVVRVRHEACARWDRAGLPGAPVPDELAARKMNLGTMTLAAQFSSALLAQPADVVVLSIQADVTNVLKRHRRDGYAFLDAGQGSADDARWSAEEFAFVPHCTPQESMASLGRIIDAVRATSNATILVYNMSSVAPGDKLDSYLGLEDALSLRIRRYNLALFDLAKERSDFTVVDVDQIVARAGAARVKLDTLHYHRDGYRLIAAEVLRILEDRGQLD